MSNIPCMCLRNNMETSKKYNMRLINTQQTIVFLYHYNSPK